MMNILVYINKDHSYTINVFNSDGYTAGALSTKVRADAVNFIDSARQVEPENTTTKIINAQGEMSTLDLFASKQALTHALSFEEAVA